MLILENEFPGPQLLGNCLPPACGCWVGHWVPHSAPEVPLCPPGLGLRTMSVLLTAKWSQLKKCVRRLILYRHLALVSVSLGLRKASVDIN